MCLNVENISKNFMVKKITEDTIYEVVQLCKENHTFYQYSNSEASIDSVRADLIALPPKKELKDKYYIGFYKDNKLYALMDLLIKYPNQATAYIGLFLVNKNHQRKGIGTQILNDVSKFLEKLGFSFIQLGCIKENTEGKEFWKHHMFLPTGRETKQKDDVVIISMERKLQTVQ